MIFWRVSLFAGMLAAAGIPLYIHVPQFATTELGLSLSTVGAVLIGIRLFDFVQDPLLGHLVDRWPRGRFVLVALAVVGLAAGFLMLFSLPPLWNTTLWLTISLALVFTAYSLATILFYGQGVAIAGKENAEAHYRLAGFRETGTLAGVVLAAVAPTLLQRIGTGAEAYRDFGILLAILAVAVWLLTTGLWAKAPPLPTHGHDHLPFRRMLDSGLPRLLTLALLNALPVAITSTLFLFFVDDRLGLPDYAGGFLLLFFVAAGATAPLWSRLVRAHGPKRVLVPAMALAIAAFAWASVIPDGAAVEFGLICVASGAALGADMVILPALFATVLAREDLPAGIGFGLWAFASKLALALAAAAVLPALQASGFRPGVPNSAGALTMLTLAYAALPCALKLLAIAMVVKLPAAEIPA